MDHSRPLITDLPDSPNAPKPIPITCRDYLRCDLPAPTLPTSVPILSLFLLLLTACQSEPAPLTLRHFPAPIDSVAVGLKVAPPPPIVIDYDTTRWLDLAHLEPTLQIDIRYATDSNFMERRVYDCGRCWLRPAVAEAVVAVHHQLRTQGYGLKLWDCYRPRPVQWELWKTTPDRRYVSDPRRGSMHNRGAAVDLTLVDSLGHEVDMGTPYDFFGPRAYTAYTDLPEPVLEHRRLLRETMVEHGFRFIRTEWWHYAYRGGGYPLSDDLWPCGER